MITKDEYRVLKMLDRGKTVNVSILQRPKYSAYAANLALQHFIGPAHDPSGNIDDNHCRMEIPGYIAMSEYRDAHRWLTLENVVRSIVVPIIIGALSTFITALLSGLLKSLL